MVDIYLKVENDPPVLALSIPLNDIQRLSLRPLKWLRYITFAVCGARGDLSTTPDSPAVDYDSVHHLDPVAEAYYYTPQETYRLIDHSGLNERITSSAQTTRRSRFREDIMGRDGSRCVFTREIPLLCDATHIIPSCKGDEYIQAVLQDRGALYDPAPDETSIDSIQNGIFVCKDVHTLFGIGSCAFLNTPNFALDTTDIAFTALDGPMSATRITLQHLIPHGGVRPILPFDACIAGTGNLPPPAILLDYMYGVAAYRRWGCGEHIKELMERRFTERYGTLPAPPVSGSASDDEDSGPSGDAHDSDSQPNRQRRGGARRHGSTMSAGMLQAMDDVLLLSMLTRGTTPESVSRERRRREEEEELRRQEASRSKVEAWKQASLE
ncbi:hypothetical protein JAAARDRAFT_301400 [Jaapia argillacea MUCL 33604]|uniref:HNH nuclease domain-containing protein n=1 Tax=Jaapia argillacea MUCL 33604 TaxID=933084 RepID=A0A067PZU9_9AGAM|nr:hypothetical protein JAAARDRAFT_301400 [Jaapia argillacea MUCL 33604]